MIMSSLNVEMVKRILVFGFQGKVGAIGTYDEILQIDAARPTGTYPNMSDLVESAFKRPLGKCLHVPSADDDYSLLRSFVQENYEELTEGRYAEMGDVLFVSEYQVMVLLEKGNITSHEFYSIDAVGKKSHKKAQNAADLLIFVGGYHDDGETPVTYFVGIERKHEQKKGSFALIGGKRDVLKNSSGLYVHLETAAETVIHEGEEESGLGMFPVEPERTAHEPYLPKLDVHVSLPSIRQAFTTEMLNIGTVECGPEDMLVSEGGMRVFNTTGYTIFLDLARVVNPDLLDTIFRAGDDAARMRYHRLEPGIDPEFGLSHHAMLYDMAVSHWKKEEKISENLS